MTSVSEKISATTLGTITWNSNHQSLGTIHRGIRETPTDETNVRFFPLALSLSAAECRQQLGVKTLSEMIIDETFDAEINRLRETPLDREQIDEMVG